jgi:hypothetical protein
MRARNYLLPLLVGIVFTPFFFNAQQNNDPVFAVEVLLKSEGKKVHNYQIILSQDNLPEDTVSISGGKDVYVTLSKNEIYYFTFHKKGFKDRIVVVNTTLPEDASMEEIFTLDFTVEMEHEMVMNDASGNDAEKSGKKISSVYVKYDNVQADFALCDYGRD